MTAKMTKLSPMQHQEIKFAYQSFNRNQNYSAGHAPKNKLAQKSLAKKGMIATVPVGNGVQHTGLTKRGLEYCRQWFPMFEVVS